MGKIIILSSTHFSTDSSQNSKQHQLSEKLWEGIPTWKYRAVVGAGGERDLDPAFMETWAVSGSEKRGWYVQGWM